ILCHSALEPVFQFVGTGRSPFDAGSSLTGPQDRSPVIRLEDRCLLVTWIRRLSFGSRSSLPVRRARSPATRPKIFSSGSQGSIACCPTQRPPLPVHRDLSLTIWLDHLPLRYVRIDRLPVGSRTAAFSPLG